MTRVVSDRNLRNSFLGFLTSLLVCTACTKALKPIAPFQTGFVAHYESSESTTRPESQVSTQWYLQETESDGKGHVRINTRVKRDDKTASNNSWGWTLEDYNTQRCFRVLDKQRIYTEIPAKPASMDVNDPADFLDAKQLPDVHLKFVGMEDVDGHSCKHYSGNARHPMSDHWRAVDIWYCPELHCAVKMKGKVLVHDQQLVKYDPEPADKLISIPANYRLVNPDDFTFQWNKEVHQQQGE